MTYKSTVNPREGANVTHRRCPPTVLDLFCGAGGLSYGFSQAGFDVTRALDVDQAAVETHNTNLGDCAFVRDLSTDVSLSRADVVVGGPPCQGFSSAGLRKNDDVRNSLVGRFARIIEELLPTAFVFENVEGFLTAQNGARVLELLTPLVAAGYRIHLRKVNAANYGVPQHRKRVIAIGGLGWTPSFPPPTHSAYGAPGASLASKHLPRTPTLEEALGGLSQPTTSSPGSPQGHFHRPLKGKDLARAIALKPGQTMRDLPQDLQHASYLRRSARRVIDGTPSERRGGPPSGIRRLRSDEPSKAITGGARAEFLHPYEHRSLTVRECARLQTFPDDFVFHGSTTEQMRLIGNAVPPLLAYAFASSLLIDLDSTKPDLRSGALLSFEPTLSQGLSPILKRVTTMVSTKFLCEPGVKAEELTLWD